MARIDNGSKKYGQPAVALKRADLPEVLTKEMLRQGIAVGNEKRFTRGRRRTEYGATTV